MLIREVAKRETAPGAYGLLAGLLVLLLAAVANAGCALYPEVQSTAYKADEPYGATRDLPAQMISTVKIMTECGSGTGVMLDQWHVLTAHHVINCADWPKVKVAQKVVLEMIDGSRYEMTYEKLSGSLDVARLLLRKPVPHVLPVRVVPARVGDTACLAAAVPDREVKCAPIALLRDHEKTRDIGVEWTDIWFGNSGSGVYNQDGALIGVASALLFCNESDRAMFELLGERPDHVCGGFATSIPKDMQ